MNLLSIYYKFPIPLQNFTLSLYGFKLKTFRYNKKFKKTLKVIRERNQFSINEMQELQDKMLQRIIKHAYENVPFYHKQMDQLKIRPDMIKSIADLEKLPIISKDDVKANIDAFHATNINRTKDNHTGGTTGSPLVIKTTNEEERYNFALYEVREKELFGVNTGLKTATFLGKKIVDPYANKPPYWRKVSSLNQTMYSIYHMKNDTFKYYIDNLRKDPPVYITGYVNPIYQLAKYIIDNDITPLKVKAIFVSSETLHTWQKEFIEKAFSCEVCNGYSQAEGVSFISSCRNGNLHVHPDYGVTEFIKVEGTEYYEIVGTTLFNYAMPLIRYRTKDYVIFDEKQRCECGLPYFPIVKEIVGRNDSSIKSPSGKVISSAALSLIFKHFPQIKETQLIQEDDYRINVLLIIDGDINDEFGRDFTEELCSVIGEEFDIVLTKVELIPKSSSGKHKLIISKV